MLIHNSLRQERPTTLFQNELIRINILNILYNLHGEHKPIAHIHLRQAVEEGEVRHSHSEEGKNYAVDNHAAQDMSCGALDS